jgi:hypothetical protein
MLTMREDIQKHGARQLSRREEWARSVRGVYRGSAYFVSHCWTNNFINEVFKDQTAHGRGEKPKAG